LAKPPARPPYRPEPGRARGRPPILPLEDETPNPPQPLPPVTVLDRQAIECSALEEPIAHLDQVLRGTRRSLETLARGTPAGK